MPNAPDSASAATTATTIGRRYRNGSSRAIRAASDATRIGLSPFGRIEGLKEARNTASLIALSDEAEALLKAGLPVNSLTAKVQDVGGARFRQDYDFGDRLTVQMYDETFDCRLSAYSIAYDRDRGETVRIALRSET